MANELQEKNKPVFGTIPESGTLLFTDAASAHTYNVNANLFAVITGSQKGTLVDSLFVVSNDTVNRLMAIYLRDGADLMPIGIFNVPANSGTNGTVLPFDLLSNANASNLPISNQGKRYIRLANGQELVAGILTVPSAGKFFNVVAQCTVINETP